MPRPPFTHIIILVSFDADLIITATLGMETFQFIEITDNIMLNYSIILIRVCGDVGPRDKSYLGQKMESLNINLCIQSLWGPLRRNLFISTQSKLRGK
jgi:hypothetical protein